MDQNVQIQSGPDMGAGGCFAIGGVVPGGTDAQMQACRSGARNASGDWLRDSGDGHEYILPAAERARLGCTTN